MFFDNNDDCAQLLPPEDSSNYESLHKFIVAQGNEFRLCANTNSNLEAAVNFSRAFYNLDPSVAAYALVGESESKSMNSEAVDEGDGNDNSEAAAAAAAAAVSSDSPYFLSQSEHCTFESWQSLLKSTGDDIRLSSPADVSRYVLRFLNSCCCSDATSGSSGDDTASTTTDDTSANVFKGITRVHIRALEDMMSLLPVRNSRYRMDQLQVMHPLTHPRTHSLIHLINSPSSAH